MSRTRETKSDGSALKVLRGFIRLFIITSAVVIEAGNSKDDHPYLLFSTQQSIYKYILNGSSSTTNEILTPSSLGIVGLSYHYRLGSLFWANGQFLRPAILTADIDGSNMRELVSFDLGEPADLEVDWINDRLYWVDRTRRLISEYDLITGHRSVVLSTGPPGISNPSALALYPYPNYGWVYWNDGNNLEKASVTGDDRSTLRSDLSCVNVLTIDYASTTIYWIDHCLYQIQSLRLDGDATSHSYPFTTFIFFASGLVIKNDTFYWSDQDGVFERKNLTNAIVNTIYDVPRGSRATGLQLVHSTVQPQVDDFIEIIAPINGSSTFQCSAECVNGNCIPPGLCACSAGWRGASCDTDVNECDRQNGGCEHECVNEVGSHHCLCPDGYVLTDDHHTCKDVDECLTTEGGGVCQQVCTNLPGSFLCDCDPGFTLDSDQVNCVGSSHHTPVEPTRVMTSSTGGVSSTQTQIDESVMFSADTGPIPSSTTSSSASGEVSTVMDLLDLSTTVFVPTSDTGIISTSSFSSSTTQTGVVSRELDVFSTTAVLPTVYESSRTVTMSSTSQRSPDHTTSTSHTIPTIISQQSTVPSPLKTIPGDRKTSLTMPVTSPPPSTSQPQSLYHTVSFPRESSSTPLPTFTPDLEVEIALNKKGNGSRDTAIIAATVTLVTICIIIAIVALLVAIVAVRRKRRKSTGSFTPEQQQHTSMTLNLSVKRISSTFSYTSKP